jgi:cytidyltransferase-like protein
MRTIYVSASFDDLRSRHVRFLDEASRLGEVRVLLWSDEVVRAVEGRKPKFPQAERAYFLEAVRYVSRVELVDELPGQDVLPAAVVAPNSVWVVDEPGDNSARRAFCQSTGMDYVVISETQLAGFPQLAAAETGAQPGKKTVLVTGCYDWFHSGHVRFFEEVSQLGDLCVVVGNDANVRLLKGEGHPLIGQDERRYMVQSIRYVRQALISSGFGWMDAEPEIDVVKPDIYAVNEDGDKPEKRVFSQEHGLEYVVLKRLPKEGLPKRESTNLRGF